MNSFLIPFSSNEYSAKIGEAFEYFKSLGCPQFSHKPGYETIDVQGEHFEIMSIGGKYRPLKYISRHKTPKHMVEIAVNSILGCTTLKTTTDHVCMVYGKDHFFENKAAKDLSIGDYVSVFNPRCCKEEHVGEIVSVKDLGSTEEWVYDCEVEGNSPEEHSFYADSILVHNSQFVNISCVTENFSKKKDFPAKLKDWSNEQKLALWTWMDNFVENKVNPFVQELVKEKCKTEHPEVLRYSLEYIGDAGIFEKKKHYGIHKIVSEGPELVDKIKYTGIELKKATIPVKVKAFLKDIYENTIRGNWNSEDFKRYVLKCYDEFSKLSIEEVALWKGWSSDKIEPLGFLTGAKGMTGLSKACHFYNEMLDHLKLGKKYERIKLGDKVRMVYINPNSEYKIECIAFPDGAWPKEFDGLFTVDYPKMFEKLLMQPLEAYFTATHFEKVDPRLQPVFDVDDL